MNKNMCKHNSGIVPAVCEAGIDRFAVVKPEFGGGWINNLPCVMGDKVAKIPCDKYEPISKEELEEKEDCAIKTKASMKILEPIIRKIKKDYKNVDVCGTLICPICSGKLHYKQSGHNNHMSMACETNGCVSFME